MSELLTKDDILTLPRLLGGSIRHTVFNEDGSVESVAINNLLAIKNAFCTDFSGNQFGCYFIVPDSYWRVMKREWRELYRNDWTWLPKDVNGGYQGMMPYVTIYVGGVSDLVVMKPDIGELVFEFTVGLTHEILISKSALVEEFGYEVVGYDIRQVFVPWWEYYGCAYAPPGLLLSWGNFKPAVQLLENPPDAALKQWFNQGLIAAPVKEAVVALIEGKTYYPQLTAGVVNADYTISAE